MSEKHIDKHYILSKINTDNAVAAYICGSTVYRTNNSDSDIDCVVITQSYDFESFVIGNIDCKYVSLKNFKLLLEAHEISALECLFLDDNFILISPKIELEFSINLNKLRHSISEKASHSWVKAKKKFISPYENLDNEIYRGKKSLYHSLRIISYGIQIAESGRIYKYNVLHDEFCDIISDNSNEWKHYDDKYRTMFNSMMTKFRKLAPKERDKI